jgi:hypothetical protein
MDDIRITGISIGYYNNLIYECSGPEAIEEFRSYLDSSEVKRLDKVLLWFASGDSNLFLVAEPSTQGNIEWLVRSENFPEFTFMHQDGKNLLDEIQVHIRRSGYIRTEHSDQRL